MKAHSRSTYLFYGAVAVLLIVATLWSSHDTARSARGALEEVSRTQVLVFGADSLHRESTEAVTDSFVAPAPAVRNSVLQRLREMRVRFRQLDPRIQVSVSPGPQSLRALGDTLSAMLASSYLTTSTRAAKHTALPAEQSATVTLTGSIADRPLIFQLVRALSPYLSGAVLVEYDETARAGTLQLTLSGEPGFYANGAVLLPPLAASAQAGHARASSAAEQDS